MLQYNLSIDLNVLLKFASKYCDTKLFKQLSNTSKISDENLLKKITFLAKNSKISDLNTLEKLITISMSELQKMCYENEEDGNILSYLPGGPISKTIYSVFADSYEREIRRIDPDGSYKILPLLFEQGHAEGVNIIYKDSITFKDKKGSAVEYSLEATKKLSSITFVIENEQCFIYMPIQITEEQKNIVKNWINSTTEYGKLGIMLYNAKLDKSILANEGDMLNKEGAMDFINNIEIKDKNIIDMGELGEDISNLYETEIGGIVKVGDGIYHSSGENDNILG